MQNAQATTAGRDDGKAAGVAAAALARLVSVLLPSWLLPPCAVVGVAWLLELFVFLVACSGLLRGWWISRSHRREAGHQQGR